MKKTVTPIVKIMPGAKQEESGFFDKLVSFGKSAVSGVGDVVKWGLDNKETIGGAINVGKTVLSAYFIVFIYIYLFLFFFV